MAPVYFADASQTAGPGHTWEVDSSFDLHCQRRALFSGSASVYDAGRPGYPAEVFELLATQCGLEAGSRVVEIGPGTGQATGPLLDAGANVVAVELGAEMATLLEENHGSRHLTIVVGAFEDVDLPAQGFDIVASATAFHWVDPAVGLIRSADLLRPGGSLALWWNYFGDPHRSDPFHDAIQPLLQSHAPQLIDCTSGGAPGSGAHPYALDVDARVDEIGRTGRFGAVRYEAVSWTGRHSASEIHRMFGSFSPWLALESTVRGKLLDALANLVEQDFGGTVRRPYLTPIYTAQRI